MATGFDGEGPNYTLGRPFPSDVAVQFDKVEADVASLLELCSANREQGGCVIVSADAPSESHLYHTLAVLSSRLRRRGYEAEFPSIPFSTRLLPVPNGVSIVMDAPLRHWGDEWSKPRGGTVTILAGLVGHWDFLGIMPAIDCSVKSDLRGGRDFQREVTRWQKQFLNGTPSARLAYLAAAAGCDLPAAAFPDGDIPEAASPVLDLFGAPTGFWSAPGHYLANAALGGMWSREEARRATAETAFQLTGLLTDCPLVLERFGFGLGWIVSNRTIE